MTYQEIQAKARDCVGPYCKSCPVCNGLACKNTIPGPGAKGIGTGFIRNYQKWQELCVNMDTICENKPVDTSFDFFGRKVALPVFAARCTTAISTATLPTMRSWSPPARKTASPPSPVTAPIPP